MNETGALSSLPAAQVKVFAAAEVGLPPEQYSEFSTIQTNLDQVVVVVRSFEAFKDAMLAYRLPACAGLLVLTALLVSFRAWQGLLIRFMLTAAVGSVLVEQSCVARIFKAFAVYRARKILGVQANFFLSARLSAASCGLLLESELHASAVQCTACCKTKEALVGVSATRCAGSQSQGLHKTGKEEFRPALGAKRHAAPDSKRSRSSQQQPAWPVQEHCQCFWLAPDVAAERGLLYKKLSC